MKVTAVRCAFLLASMACFSVGEASATAITVNNPSFETIPAGGLRSGCGTGCTFDSNAISGWNGGDGQFQPGPPSGTTAYFNDIPDGITVAFTNGPAISQTTGATVQDGITYILTVEIGTRNDIGFGGSADLVIGGTNFVLASGTPASRGEWATYTASFTGTALTAGQSIGIQLNNAGIQGDFDNVQLSSNAAGPVVPEPSSLSLLTLGLGGLAGAVRRKLRS